MQRHSWDVHEPELCQIHIQVSLKDFKDELNASTYTGHPSSVSRWPLISTATHTITQCSHWKLQIPLYFERFVLARSASRWGMGNTFLMWCKLHRKGIHSEVPDRRSRAQCFRVSDWNLWNWLWDLVPSLVGSCHHICHCCRPLMGSSLSKQCDAHACWDIWGRPLGHPLSSLWQHRRSTILNCDTNSCY